MGKLISGTHYSYNRRLFNHPMATLVNVADLEFVPDLTEEQKDRLSEIDFSDYKGTWHVFLDDDALCSVLEKPFGIEIEDIIGDPIFWPTRDEISLIQDEASRILTEDGSIGDGICAAIEEVTGITDCNKDTVYSDTGLSSWSLSF
jgi:hypothetical protein